MRNVTREYEMLVLVNGKPIPEYLHNSMMFIEGREGTEYELVFKNNTARPALFVASVDGLSILDGKACSAKSSGYVVDAGREVRIPGWKVNGSTAAKFTFGKSTKSYVNESKGGTDNAGVIAVRVFREKDKPLYVQGYYHVDTRPILGGPLRSVRRKTFGPVWESSKASSMSYTASANASIGVNASLSNTISGSSLDWQEADAAQAFSDSAPEEKLGTVFGKATEHNTIKMDFERANPDVPDAELVLFYNTKRNLEYIGVDVRRRKPKLPNAFPGDGCQPPKGWRG